MNTTIERPRKMELLHTPKMELTRLMRQNSLNLEEIVFMVESNKINASDIRIHAPAICDKILKGTLRQLMMASDTVADDTKHMQNKPMESATATRREIPQMIA